MAVSETVFKTYIH